MRWLTVLVTSVALGLATAAADTVASGLDQSAAGRALAMVANAGCVWAGLAVLAGFLVSGTTQRGSVLRPGAAGLVALLVAVLGYYAFGAVAGDRQEVALTALSGAVRLWALASVVLGPVLGAVGAATRRAGALGVVARLVVPVGAAVEMLGLRRLGPDSFRVDPTLACAQSALVVAALVGGLLAVLARPAQQAR